MALVRCSCIVGLRASTDGRGALDILVLDPECGYILHRLGAELVSGTGTEAGTDTPLG